MRNVLVLIFIAISSLVHGQVDDSIDKEQIVEKVNAIRSEGRYCGKKYMNATTPIKWDDLLYKSASSHVNDMYEHDYFSHHARSGKPFSARFDEVGYEWVETGENIAEGQKSLNEVLKDWLKSPHHCSLIMSGKVEDMAIANKGDYWVQHFGKKIPEGAVKKGSVIYLKK